MTRLEPKATNNLHDCSASLVVWTSASCDSQVTLAFTSFFVSGWADIYVLALCAGRHSILYGARHYKNAINTDRCCFIVTDSAHTSWKKHVTEADISAALGQAALCRQAMPCFWYSLSKFSSLLSIVKCLFPETQKFGLIIWTFCAWRMRWVAARSLDAQSRNQTNP